MRKIREIIRKCCMETYGFMPKEKDIKLLESHKKDGTFEYILVDINGKMYECIDESTVRPYEV